MTPASSANRARTLAPPILLFALGLALRLYRVNWQSIWLDEIFSIVMSGRNTAAMWQEIVADYAHPPLHYFLLHAVFGIAGYGGLQARLVSVFFGTLTIPVMYLLGQYLFGRTGAWIAALLLAVSQTGVYYSQEARAYEMFLFFVLLTSYLFLVAFREKRRPYWWGAAASALLMIYSNWFGFLVLGALAIVAYVERREHRVPLRWWLAAGALLFVLYLPWLTSGVLHEMMNSERVMAVTRREGLGIDWTAPIGIFNRFNNGKWFGLRSGSPAWSVVVSALPFLIALASAARDRRQIKNIIAVLVFLLFPLAAILAAQALNFYSVWDYRQVAFAVAPYYLLVAAGLAAMPNPWRLVVLACILAGSVAALRSNYFLPHKENYRDAVAYLDAQTRPGDCLLFQPVSRIKRMPLFWLAFRRDQPAPQRVVSFDEVQANACSRVWVLFDGLFSVDQVPAETKARQAWLNGNLTVTDSQEWFGVKLRLLERR